MSKLVLVLLATSVLAAMCCAPLKGDTGIISWNAFSKQFIDAPTFELLPVPGTVEYRAVAELNGKTWKVSSRSPRLDLSGVWRQIPFKKLSLTIEWIDKDGKRIASETRPRVKAPDWNGFHEVPGDWKGAADSNIKYLLDVADHGVTPYREPGVPVIVWSCLSASAEYPKGWALGYPGITFPYYIWACLEHAESGGKHAKQTMQLAKAVADWALKNRLPADSVLPLLPYSVLVDGKYEGGVPGQTIDLLRSCLLGESMVDMYKVTKDNRYLDYARHIANVVLKFQRPDGSFPYRIDRQTGNVTEQYTCCAIQFINLVEALETCEYDRRLAKSSRRAVKWMLAYVYSSSHWKAVYEDIPQMEDPYTNLSQSEAQPLIQYLCRHKDDNPQYVKMARKLNRWIEDQFVNFGRGSEAHDRPIKGPLVFEQYEYWFPMEFHTGRWIRSLIALHRVTGDRSYLKKAMAAGNAIIAQQFSNGAFSTNGRRYIENGRLVPEEDVGANWYNCNAMADVALYELDSYVKSLSK